MKPIRCKPLNVNWTSNAPRATLPTPFLSFKILPVLLFIGITQPSCLVTNTYKLAEQRAQEGDYQGAIDMYQAVIREKPETSAARKAQLAVGRLHIDKMNRPESGVSMYQELIATAPDSEETAEAYYRLGFYYFKSADYVSAQKSFDTVVNQFPHLERSHNAQLMLAKTYENAQNFEKAVEVYENVANRHPDGKRAGQALINKARIQKQFLKDKKEAERTYQLLVKRYGRIEGAERTIEEAKRELQLMGTNIPEPDPLFTSQRDRMLQRQKERRERDRPRDGVDLSPGMADLDLAAASGFDVNTQELMSAFGPIRLDAQGTFFNSILMVANGMFQSENYRMAGALYYRATELAEGVESEVDPYHYLRLSVCYRKIGLHQRARDVLKKALKKDRSILDSIITSGTTQYIDGDYKKAIETYNSVLGLSPTKIPELYWRLGLVYKRMGDPEKEREYFERAIAADTDYTDALQSLAEVLHYRLNDTLSAEIFQDLVDLQSNKAISDQRTYAGEKALADICYRYGNYPRAKTKYEAAARIAQREKSDPTNEFKARILNDQRIYATVHAAMASYNSGMKNEAQAAINTLAVEYPDHSLTLYGRGQLALLSGEEDAGLAAFAASMEKNPYSDTVPLALGEYYLSRGFTDEAVGVWEEFIKVNPHRNRHYRVQQRLETVKDRLTH